MSATAGTADAGQPFVAGRRQSATRRNLNLLRELALTQFKLKYTGSVLGYLWSLFKPALLFGIMYVVFVHLLKAGSATPEFPVQLLLGVVLWTFFVEATSSAMNSIAGAGGLIQKAYFPRWILVLASIAAALITFLINASLIIVITIPIHHMHPGLRSLLAPLFILELALLVVGLALLLSSAFVFYRDVGHIWEIITLVLFYGSAVVYPFTILHNQVLRVVAGINPLAQIIEDLRHALVSPGVPWMESVLGGLYVIPLAAVLVLFIGGVITFRRLTPRFAEYL